MPILCSSGPTVNPGVPLSTMKPVNCSPSTLAKTMNTSAKPALVMYSFEPFRIQCLPSGDQHRLGLRAERVGARLPGSVSAYAATSSPVASFGRYFSFCCLGAEADDRQRADAHVRAEGHRPRAQRSPSPPRPACERRLVQREPAVLLGDVEPEQAQLARLAQQLAQQRVVLLLDPLGVRDHPLLGEPVRGLEEGSLLVGEVLRSADRLGPDGGQKEPASGGKDGNIQVFCGVGHGQLR